MGSGEQAGNCRTESCQWLSKSAISDTVCSSRVSKNGLRSKLITLLLDRAASLEAKACFLEVRVSNDRAISLYRSLGFTQIGERSNYYPGDAGREDALILSRSLPLL